MGMLVMGWLICHTLAAQNDSPRTSVQSGTGVENYLRQAGDHAALYTGRLLTINKTTGWMTHPYWDDDKFHQGTVCYDGILYPLVAIRYDIYLDELEVMAPVNNHVVLPEKNKVWYFTIDNMRFIPRPEGYMAQLYDGKLASLQLQRTKRQDTDKLVNGEYFKKDLLITNSYKLHYDGKDYLVKNLKDVQKVLPQYRQEMADYSRRKGLSYNKLDKEESLKQLVAYVDGLLLKNYPVRQKGRTSTVISAPDSLFQQLTQEPMPETSPSFRAFREGTDVTTIVYEEVDDAAGTTTAGVSKLKPMKEERILDELEIIAFQSKLSSTQTGLEKFRPQQLRNMPMAMGEADVMKMVLSLPGVSTVGEASSGFNVRGGASDQNLILLGSNTVFNTMHLFGIFSAFNTDYISDVSLYKSGIPAQYGGRISSVMELTPRLADRKQWSASATIGLLTSKGELNIPIIKNRLSLSLAARTTYSDWMLKLLSKRSDYRDGSAGFYDTNASLSWMVNRNHYVNIYGYFSRDRFSFSKNDRYAYVNANGSVEWKGHWNDRLSSVVQAGWDHYDYDRRESENPSTAALLTYDLQQRFLKTNFKWEHGNEHVLKFGFNALLYLVNPGQMDPFGNESYIQHDRLEEQKALEAGIYAEEEWHLTKRWMLNAGLRLNIFNSNQEGKEHTYLHPEGRLSASYKLNDTQSLKAGVNMMHQYLHKLSNTVIMSPTDTWTLSNDIIKPQNGWQVSAGYFWEMLNRKFEASAEVYYKQMNNYLTYKNAAQLTMNHELENDVFGAKGRSYGIELQVKKPIGKLNGWISYTYSRSQLRQPNGTAFQIINDGKWFTSDFDHPHELNFVGNYRFTRRYSMSLNMDYSTGRPTTVPVGKYYDRSQQRFLPLYGERNGYRLPDYFRADLAFNIEPGHHLTNLTHSRFTIGCYNVLGRRNAYNVYFVSDYSGIKAKRISVFGAPIPFVSYSIKFN